MDFYTFHRASPDVESRRASTARKSTGTAIASSTIWCWITVWAAASESMKSRFWGTTMRLTRCASRSAHIWGCLSCCASSWCSSRSWRRCQLCRRHCDASTIRFAHSLWAFSGLSWESSAQFQRRSSSAVWLTSRAFCGRRIAESAEALACSTTTNRWRSTCWCWRSSAKLAPFCSSSSLGSITFRRKSATWSSRLTAINCRRLISTSRRRSRNINNLVIRSWFIYPEVIFEWSASRKPKLFI